MRMQTKWTLNLPEQLAMVRLLSPDYERYISRMERSPGEIALYFNEKGTVLFGDIVAGEPMGRLSLLADDKLEDAPKAAMQLRKVLALRFNTVLVGDGHSLFKEGRQELVDCLQARGRYLYQSYQH